MSTSWLVSRRFDLLFFSGPALLTAAIALAIPPVELGLFGWLALVVVFDVGHVWATIYRAWLDPAIRRDLPDVLWAVPLVALVSTSLVQALAPAWLWTAMAYTAIYHFVRQQQGFAALYRHRLGVAHASVEARVEHGFVAMLCLFPVLWWHAHLPRAFSWFTADDMIRGLPSWVLWPAGAATIGLGLAWLRLHTPSWGRDLWVVSTGATWFTGIVLTNGDAPFTVANVVAHAVPYFALVHHVGARAWTQRGGGPVGRWLYSLPLLPVFLAVPITLALFEELAWDAAVWREHLFGPAELPEWLPLVVTPVLASIQLTHYLLDGYIWKGRARP